jgi:acetyl esterase/lipase
MVKLLRSKIVRVFGLGLLAIVTVAVVGFVIWAQDAHPPEPEALAALNETSAIEIETEPWLSFNPTSPGQPVTTGLILYPGGRVDPRAYAPVARLIALRGYRVVIVPMPLNLAFFAPRRADAVIAAYPEVQTWAVGGHSLGGAMAALYVDRSAPDAVAGLALWAAYPAEPNDLSDAEELTAVTIYGTRDGLMTEEEFESSWALLPPITRRVTIEGGNHAQFGAYGPQNGDQSATISAQSQQGMIVEATVGLLLDGLHEPRFGGLPAALQADAGLD